MIILSDCLTRKADEGALKTAGSLAAKIKEKDPSVTLISYGGKGNPANGGSDLHLNLNPLFLNRSLFSAVKKDGTSVLYIPFSSNTTAAAVRTWVLSLVSKKRVRVLFVLRHPMNRLSCLFLKWSRAEIFALSEESAQYYHAVTGNPAVYLKTGVDTKRFVPADAKKKQKLREKYHVKPDETVVLHIGHLNQGRNIGTLLNLDPSLRIFLVISSVTEQDPALKQQLLTRNNITIIDSWVERVEELYQMADLYYFPVQEKEHCIDTPLSVLEAASCNLPVVSTDYGELKNFRNEPGFYFISSFEPETLDRAVQSIKSYRGNTNRTSVLSYDWDRAAEQLLKKKIKL